MHEQDGGRVLTGMQIVQQQAQCEYDVRDKYDRPGQPAQLLAALQGRWKLHWAYLEVSRWPEGW